MMLEETYSFIAFEGEAMNGGIPLGKLNAIVLQYLKFYCDLVAPPTIILN
jgi:hypothetical protein